jgi:hypothetical protein
MKRIKFPEVTDLEIAFGGYPEKWFNKMLANKYKEVISNKAYQSLMAYEVSITD